MTIPPGQRLIDEFPRYGVPGPGPRVPPNQSIEISGALAAPLTLPVPGLRQLPRHQMTADFHCVAGWTAPNLHWEGVRFADLFRLLVEPALPAGTAITHVVFEGLDGFRSTLLIEDALSPDVLLAENLNGQPLDNDHGAPMRVVSPQQYGYMNTKHLCRVELHTARPPAVYHSHPRTQFGLQLLKPHPRARVRHEERHGHLPGRVVRPIYQGLRILGLGKSASSRSGG